MEEQGIHLAGTVRNYKSKMRHFRNFLVEKRMEEMDIAMLTPVHIQHFDDYLMLYRSPSKNGERLNDRSAVHKRLVTMLDEAVRH